MDNKEISEEERLEIIREMIDAWENEGTDSIEDTLESAFKIKDSELLELAEKAMGFLAELESVKDEIDGIMWDYSEIIDKQ
ncbi:hypothetical protein [Sebaldella sp. S0638]|uniref:hypothetical protein n=1 Tax=Sebaldella sp. S0638 TaxID=2957809 RepID=UPI00209D21B5|nr:hypothetical protein [Sebaldella sp. S0638]MCP1226530.1 hypothetical protein [Sebaldella sp. S0638]